MKSLMQVLTGLNMKYPTGNASISAWPAEKLDKFLGALTYFMQEPALDTRKTLVAVRAMQEEKRLAMKGSTTPSMTPTGMIIDPYEMERWHVGVEQVDLGYESLFALVDMRNTGKPFFKINKVSSGLTWKQVEPGEAAKIYSPGDRANELTVEFLEFATGLGFQDRWFEFEEFWNIEDTALEFRAKMYKMKAQLYYSLLATGILETAFDENLVTTINNACVTIIRDLVKDSFEIGNNPSFDIVCPPEQLQKVRAALDTKLNMYSRSQLGGELNYTIRNVISTHNYCDAAGASVTDKIDVVYPGMKLKRGEWLDLRTEMERDAKKAASNIIGRVRFNGGKGTLKQARRLSLG